MARLKIQEKKASSPQEFELSLDRITLGRAPDNVLVLEDKAASRHHAELRRSGGGWLLVDLGSSNGTWIDGKKVGTVELSEGLVFLIGNTRLSFMEEAWDGRTLQVDMKEMIEGEAVASSPRPVSTPVGPPAAAPAPPVQAPAVPVQAPLPPVMAPPISPPPALAPSPPPFAPAPAAPAVPQQVQLSPQPLPPLVAAPAAPILPDYQPSSSMVEGGVRAGFGIRLGAYFLDALILGVIMVVLMLPLGILIQIVARKAPGLMIALSIGSYLLVMVVSIAYILIPWAKSGATPGKKILHLRIVRDDGVERLGYGKAAMRMLGYMLSGMILYIGFLMILFNDDKKGLHDMIAGTHVIRV